MSIPPLLDLNSLNHHGDPRVKRYLLQKNTFKDVSTLTAKKVNSWKSLNEHISKSVACRKLRNNELSVSENRKFHLMMKNNYAFTTSKIIRFMNLQDKVNFWLFPTNASEPAFDCIFVKNSDEVWLLQLTVATSHSANSTAVERAKRVFQDIFHINTVIRFVFVTPKSEKTFKIPSDVENHLLAQRIKYMVCNSDAYWEKGSQRQLLED